MHRTRWCGMTAALLGVVLAAGPVAAGQASSLDAAERVHSWGPGF